MSAEFRKACALSGKRSDSPAVAAFRDACGHVQVLESELAVPPRGVVLFDVRDERATSLAVRRQRDHEVAQRQRSTVTPHGSATDAETPLIWQYVRIRTIRRA